MESPSALKISRDPAGAWELVERVPPPAFRGLVRRCVGFVETAAGGCRRREVPGGSVPLILNFGAPYAVAPAVPDLAASPRPESGRCQPALGFLARISATPAVTEFAGVATGIQLDLEPAGARMLLGVPMDQLPEPVADLEHLLGPDAALLVEELALLSSWERRFIRLDEFLLGRFAAAAPVAASVEWAWEALRASGGRAQIGALAARIGCSRRHLVTGFRDLVGVPPKTAGAILRFERAARVLSRGGEGALARAAACGYYDQSHMTRDFRRFAGTTPGAFARAAGSGSLGLVEDEVKSVQDTLAAAA